MPNTKPQPILISGGARGIGKASAELLSKQYAVLAPGSKEMNVCDEGSIENFLKQHYSSPDDKLYGLICNAGIYSNNAIEKETKESWSKILETNLTGTFSLCRLALPLLKKSSDSRIIIISSVSGTDGEAYAAAYSAAKAGLIGLTKSLSMELAKYNICVNAIAPGWVRTDMALKQLNTDALIKDNLGASLQNRWIEPEEIASLVEYLLKAESRAITGQVINISAGL